MNRHFLLSAIFLFLGFISFGQGYQVQSKYFVYLQTEPAQAFYIKINGQKIDANASGYLILPQLKDGDYKLLVGFADGKTSEQVFNFKIDSKDKGYLIKDYGTDGWGLFDLQTMAVQKAIKGGNTETAVTKPPPVVQQTPKEEPKKEPEAAEGVSDFTKVLSQAAKDPSLLEKPKEEPKPEREKPVVMATKPEQESKKEPKGESLKQVVEGNPVQKDPVPQSSSADGVTLVYDDRNDFGEVDPITIFIPAPKADKRKESRKEDIKEEIKEESRPETTEEKPSSRENKKFAVEEKPAAAPHNEDSKAVIKPTNAACKSVADEDDFLKLRRAMAGETNDDNMIGQAQKAFKAKCYTTAQVKYLSSMFLSNAGKYNFYAAAKDHIADKENFYSLADDIKDQAYRDKFNNLIQ